MQQNISLLTTADYKCKNRSESFPHAFYHLQKVTLLFLHKDSKQVIIIIVFDNRFCGGQTMMPLQDITLVI